MRLPTFNRRTWALTAVLIPLLAMFAYVAVRSGPLAPIPVTVATVEESAVAPAVFGIGTVEARYTYRIGPTVAGRILRVDVHVGDYVRAGQVMGEMDPVDLDDRIVAQEAALRRAEANVLAAKAQRADVIARKRYADTQAERYERLLQSGSVSEEVVEVKRQERDVAEAGLTATEASLTAAMQELERLRAEHRGLLEQRANLRLVAPVDGLVTSRGADPGTTVVAGQTVIEMIDPASIWINARFDQSHVSGLRDGLPAQIVLRSLAGQTFTGRVLRVEPLADAITEETLAKIVFDILPEPLPPIGELVEVTVALPEMPTTPVVPNASILRVDGQIGVWLVSDDAPEFAPVRVGASDLDGRVQILDGLQSGQHVVVYSHRALVQHSRIKVVDRLPGVPS